MNTETKPILYSHISIRTSEAFTIPKTDFFHSLRLSPSMFLKSSLPATSCFVILLCGLNIYWTHISTIVSIVNFLVNIQWPFDLHDVFNTLLFFDICRSTPARHAANPYSQKRPLMLRRNSNILLLLLNFHYNSIMYFNCCAYIRIRI